MNVLSVCLLFLSKVYHASWEHPESFLSRIQISSYVIYEFQLNITQNIIPSWIVTLNEYALECPAYTQYTTHRTVCLG